MDTKISRLAVRIAGLGVICLGSSALAQDFGPWGAAEPTSITQAGCPILDPYTNDMFIASGRSGGEGANDIYRAEWDGSGWLAPENLGTEINTAAAEYCPTPTRGRKFFFVRAGDIYMTTSHPNRGYRVPVRLSDEINAGDEWSPTFLEDENGDSYLYFSSNREGTNGTQDIFVSVNFGAPTKIEELSTPGANEWRPNIRRDRLEMVFDDGAGNIYFSSRESTSDPWGSPVLFEKGNGSRASFSWDGLTLVWGDGGTIMKSERSRRTGPKIVEFP